MPYEDEFRSVLPRRTLKAYKAANAHSFNQLRQGELLRGSAEGTFVPARPSLDDELASIAEPTAEDRTFFRSEVAELVLTNERLIVFAFLPWDKLVPAKLIAEGPLEPAGRVFLPTTAKERDDPAVQTLRIPLSGGNFIPEFGHWFHFLSNQHIIERNRFRN